MGELYKTCICCKYACIPAVSIAQNYCDYCFTGLAAEPAWHREHCKKAVAPSQIISKAEAEANNIPVHPKAESVALYGFTVHSEYTTEYDSAGYPHKIRDTITDADRKAIADLATE